MIKAIVNADDFGLSENVNEAICMCFERGIITNTTIMVNMPYAADAVNLAKKKGFFNKVGLHLNLTAGVPLTGPIRSLPVFCDGNGRFNADFHLSTKTRLMLSAREKRALAEEIQAQIDRYLALGLVELHMDSHHHSHTDLSVWSVAEPILQRSGFKSVRLSRNIFEEGSTTAFNSLYKKYFNKRVKALGVKTTDYFGSFADFTAACDTLLDGSLCEIMLHPMFSESGDLMDTDVPMEKLSEFFTERKLSLMSYMDI